METIHTLTGIQPITARRGEKLREVAYRAIKDAILQGAVKPDLPLVEERLATGLAISRTPVREALAILEHEGLIEAVPYQGLFVKDISVSEFLEMYETAEVIEPELARRATPHITPDDLTFMEDLLRIAEECIPSNVPRHLQTFRQFQQRIGERAHNQYLSSLLLTIEERSDLYLISKWRDLPPEKMFAAIADRRAILEALRAGDAEAAAETSRAHARAIRLRWHELFSK